MGGILCLVNTHARLAVLYIVIGKPTGILHTITFPDTPEAC